MNQSLNGFFPLEYLEYYFRLFKIIQIYRTEVIIFFNARIYLQQIFVFIQYAKIRH